MILVFDTETTGKANFRLPADHPSQPYLVQLAAVLLEPETLVERGAFSAIIRPTCYEIPREASDIHGITTEIAGRCGFPLMAVLSSLCEMAGPVTKRIAHNLDFDDMVVASAFWRAKASPNPFALLDDVTGRRNGFCTMRAMTPVCKLPGAYDDYKWPKLVEAYRHCYGRDFEGAHDALSDVRACADVYRWLEKQKKEVAA